MPELSDILLTFPIDLVNIIIDMLISPSSSITKKVSTHLKYRQWGDHNMLVMDTINIQILFVCTFTLNIKFDYKFGCYGPNKKNVLYARWPEYHITITTNLDKKIKRILNSDLSRLEKEQKINERNLLQFNPRFNKMKWKLKCKTIKKSTSGDITDTDRNLVYLLERSYIKIVYGAKLPTITTLRNQYTISATYANLQRIGRANAEFYNRL